MTGLQSTAINILIADAHPVVLEGLASLLCSHAGMKIVGMTQNGAQAVAMYRQHRPDILIMDTFMPEMSGLDALKTIRSEFPQARVIMFSNFNTSEHIYTAMRAGAKSYLFKDGSLADMRQAVLDVAEGRTHYCPRVAERLAERLKSPELTPREMEVLGCICEGRSNLEISTKLFISEGTVKAHVFNLFSKMNVNDRTQAVVCAVRRGLVCLN